MPSKNNLSALKIQSKNTLTNIKTPSPQKTASKQSKMVGLRFTPEEYQKIKSQAGLIPVATYLRHLLAEHTDVL